MSMYRSPEKIADYLENWIRERFKEAKAERAVLGISGGIDSALLAALLAKALGPENVTGVICRATACRSTRSTRLCSRTL